MLNCECWQWMRRHGIFNRIKFAKQKKKQSNINQAPFSTACTFSRNGNYFNPFAFLNWLFNELLLFHRHPTWSHTCALHIWQKLLFWQTNTNAKSTESEARNQISSPRFITLVASHNSRTTNYSRLNGAPSCCLHFLPLAATYCLLLFLTVRSPKHWVTRRALLRITLIGNTHWPTLLENWQTPLFMFHFSQCEALRTVSRAAFRTKENSVCTRCQRDADKESCGL